MPEKTTSLSRNYYINVGKNGTFSPGENPIFNSTPDEIDRLFTELSNKKNTKIALYFHGGLVPAESGMETAERIVRYATSYTNVHPICFIWETGLSKTITDNLDTIKESEFFKKLLVKILKVVGRKLGIEIPNMAGAAKGVENLTIAEIEAELNSYAPFGNYQVNIQSKSVSVLNAESYIDEAQIEERLRPEIEEELEEEITADVQLNLLAANDKSAAESKLINPQYKNLEAGIGDKGIITTAKLIKAAVEITIRIIRRHIQRRDHGFYPTVVEEILREIYVADLGNWVWGNMKQKATDMWRQCDFHGDYKEWPVGAYFIKKLKEYNDSIGTQLTIDLIGHSAGSIVICELMRELAVSNNQISFRHVIFMAPACRCDLFDKAILSNVSRFKSFRCFTMEDELEKNDHLVKFIYPRSLLYLISGILENESDAHILGLQRHIKGVEPYTGDVFTRIAKFLNQEGNIVYAITDTNALSGFRSGAFTHGGFDDEKEMTLDSIMYLINQ